ncbi:hypothetical protein DERP_006057 [Dermatophagoides pteronyssinus]|uniref:Uncharacterized protein n=1 Tax=Dermatophagoides pteronyssinus TaxID=6956 RepID=A0ABQ8JS67_DERPT|nr:hypothetical protein DERP_006057 [Dermatophagoides pteronyssinus]
MLKHYSWGPLFFRFAFGCVGGIPNCPSEPLTPSDEYEFYPLEISSNDDDISGDVSGSNDISGGSSYCEINQTKSLSINCMNIDQQQQQQQKIQIKFKWNLKH